MANVNKSGTTWIDVTMLVNWSGQLTGIQRVEYNLAHRFAQKAYAKFCVFDKASRGFFEYDFSHIEFKIAALQVTGLEVTKAELGSTRSRYVYVLYRRLAPYLPRGAKRLIRAVQRMLRRQPKQTNEQAQLIKFEKNDKLIILSGDWSDDVFATMVTSLKREQSFKIVQIVYDLLPAVQPAFFVPGMLEQVSNYMEAIFSVSDQILAISEATKKDIQFFQKSKNLASCAVNVFRLGEDFVEGESLKPQLAIEPGKFILSVGTVEARKNHIALYYMVREAIRSNINLPTIVIAGKQGWLVDNLLYIVKNDPIISKKIIFLHNGTDSEIAWLYQNCLFTLYQSFYEGWGLPISESLFYGKLCLASNTSSMPEIAGDLVHYYSPNNPSEILKSIVKYLKEPLLLKEREQKIKEQYVLTSWDATFNQVEDYLLKI